MKFFNFKIQMTWLATWVSVVTMVTSPVAMGQEAQKISKQQVQSYIEQMGLNKPMTVGEFYKKNKYLFPDRITKELEPILANYKNVMMPKVQLSSSIGSNGNEVPTVSMDFNGQLINLQLFGEQERFAKFQNTTLSEVDVVNFSDMLSRVLAGDEVLRKQQEIQVQQPTAEFSGLPVLDKNTWKKMTLQERASYMVQIRHLWLDARQVLELQKKPAKAKKTAGLESFENFWSALIGSPADAADTKKTVAPTAKPAAAPAAKPAAPKPAAPANKTPKAFAKATATYGSTCLVAGYSAKYNGGVCDHTKLLESYSSSAFVTNMNNECKKEGPSKIACNPLVYGTPGGKAICITASTRDAEFQVATHFGGPCDRKSLLQSSPNAVKFLKDENKKTGRYDDDNLIMNEDQRKEFFRKEQEANNFAETKAFVEGILKVNDPSITDIFANGVLTDATIANLADVQKQFNDEITASVKACKDAANEKKATHEKNFYGACDQLQRRFLFISELLGPKCEPGSKINPSALKCTCSDNTTEVVPGGSCKVPPTVPAPNEPPTQQPPAQPPAVKPPPPKDKPCAAGTHAVTVTGSQSGAVSTTCEPDKKEKTDPTCGFFCKTWDFIKWSAPVTIPALAIFGMNKLWKQKEPKLNPAGDMCPNGAIPPCAQVCALPLSNINGICACAACPPGQTISSATTCACSSSSTTTTYTCWDGVTKVSDLTQCPAQTYTCWDGSKVTNALNCPEKPTTTTPTTKTETGR